MNLARKIMYCIRAGFPFFLKNPYYLKYHFTESILLGVGNFYEWLGRIIFFNLDKYVVYKFYLKRFNRKIHLKVYLVEKWSLTFSFLRNKHALLNYKN